tara:strand:+ start:1635 stop:1748 length:114 start_codon:yes stop_codon:yes gene_type:complete
MCAVAIISSFIYKNKKKEFQFNKFKLELFKRMEIKNF